MFLISLNKIVCFRKCEHLILQTSISVFMITIVLNSLIIAGGGGGKGLSITVEGAHIG